MANLVLDRIRNTLNKLVENSKGDMIGCYYGGCTESHLDKWNFFVFNRKYTDGSGKSGDPRQTYYEINIVHENFIPEGYVEEVIEALETKDSAGTKLKTTSEKITYSYDQKGKSDMIIEIATITITHPEKRY